MGEGVDLNISTIPPREVGDLSGISPILDDFYKLVEGPLRRVTPDHIVHLRVFSDDLLMEVGGGESAEDDGDIGVVFLIISARARLPWQWGIQCRSIPKARGFNEAMNRSTSYRSFLSILSAIFTILTRRPFRSRYSEILAKPTGYISKIGVEGITSLIGPNVMRRFLKSYMAGGWRRTKSG